MHNNKISSQASKFIKPGENIYLKEFTTILKLFIESFYSLANAGEMLIGLEEEVLRNKLLISLNNLKPRFELGLYRFEPETAEIRSDDTTEGYLDIKILIPNSNALSNEDKAFTVECKRLSNNSKNKKYIEEGIFRFISGKYSKDMKIAGMVGFIEQGNTKEIISDINNRLQSNYNLDELLLKHTIEGEQFEKCYKSTHKRDEYISPIDLYHLMFDTNPVKIKIEGWFRLGEIN